VQWRGTKVVDAMGVVGMGVGEDYCVEPINVSVSCSRRSGEVSASTRDAAAFSPLDQQRGPATTVLRIIRVAIAQPSAGRGTPPDDPQPGIVNFSVMPPRRSGAGPAKQPKNYPWFPWRSAPSRHAGLGQHPRSFDHKGRLVAFAAISAWCEIRRIRLDQDAIRGQALHNHTQIIGFLNVTMPVKDTNRPSATARCASSCPPCSNEGRQRMAA
jgi:hypothetical protein